MGAQPATIEWFLQPRIFGDVVQLVAGLMVESLLYGVHFVLSCIAAYKLCPHKWGPRVILFGFVIVLLAIASADLALSFWFILHDIPNVNLSPSCFKEAMRHLLIKNALFVTNNLFADSLLIYRFFVMWGKRKITVILPILILLSETTSGFLVQFHLAPIVGINTFTPGYLWCVFGLNTALTLLTAGRIWWLSRQVISTARTKRFKTIAAIFIETGAVYSLLLLCVAIIPFNNGWHFYLIALLYRFVGIMPTLMIVQIEWGREFLGSQTSASEPSSTVVVTTTPESFS